MSPPEMAGRTRPTGGHEVSHIVSIKTEIRDAEAVKAACKRLGLDEPFFGKATFYSREEHVGWCVKLPGWH